MSTGNGYPISSSVNFTNTNPGDFLNFNADGPSTALKNQIVDFVVTSPGDILFRQTQGTENILERLAIGTTGQVLTVSGTATAEETTITTVADVADSLNGTYFLLNSPTTHHYFWFNTGTAVDPGTQTPVPADLMINGNLKSGHQVMITTNDTAAFVAAALDTAINLLPDYSSVVVLDVVTATSTILGAADNAADGATPTTFNIVTSVDATSSGPVWASNPSSNTNEMFRATATASVAAAIASGPAWVTISDPAVVTWDDAAAPNHDAGGVFALGTFTVPTTGIYNISASVSLEGNNTAVLVGGIPGRTAIRQARIRKSNAVAFDIAFSEIQAMGSTLNPAQLHLTNSGASLTAGDTIVLQARHDALAALSVNVLEDTTPTTGPATYFSASRIA